MWKDSVDLRIGSSYGCSIGKKWVDIFVREINVHKGLGRSKMGTVSGEYQYKNVGKTWVKRLRSHSGESQLPVALLSLDIP